MSWRRVTCAVIAGVVLTVGRGEASQLQLPHVGGRDAGLSGNVVALPSDGPSMLFFNPAGIADLRGTEGTVGLQLFNMTGRYERKDIDYDGRSSENPLAPVIWAGTDRLGAWHVGMGLYGAIGSSYNFPADEDSGVTTRFMGELAVMQLGLVAGRELAPGLRAGFQVTPSFGMLKGRTPTPLGDLSLDLSGPGIGGTVGLLYDVTEQTTLGVSYRAPGIVFMSGDARVGEGEEDVDIDFRSPQNVTFGFAHRFTPRLTVTGQANWAKYSDFEEGEFEFERTSVLDQAFIADARDVFRWGAGLEYAALDWAWLRAGFSYEPWMIEPSAMRPALYDASDLMFMAGFGVRLERWTVDFASGFSMMDDRSISADENAFFPGRYQMEAIAAFSFMVSYRFSPT